MISAPYQDTQPPRSKQQATQSTFCTCRGNFGAQMEHLHKGKKKKKNQLILSPLPFNKAIANRIIKVTARRDI